MTQKDLYLVLEIEKKSSAEEIKKSFRRLAMQYHPDKNKEDNAEEKFKEISFAYNILSDPEKRNRYDSFGIDGVSGDQANYSDFSNFGGLGDIFDAFFQGATNQKQSNLQGTDIAVELQISLEESHSGINKQVLYERNIFCKICKNTGQKEGTELGKCNECGGSGEIRRVERQLFGQFVNVMSCNMCTGQGKVVTDPCDACSGFGIKLDKTEKNIDIPKGIRTGQKIRVNNFGNSGIRGGTAGDLYIHLNIPEHETFKRVEDNLIYELPVSVPNALLGFEEGIPLINQEKTHEMKFKPGVQHAEVFRIKNKGMPKLNSSSYGDLIVIANIIIPKRISKDEKKLIDTLSQTLKIESKKIPEELSVLHKLGINFD
jgi:molecular chaperone DnaJ